MLTERLDFSFEYKIETTDRLPKTQGQILLKQRLDFPFKNKFKTMGILPKM